MKRLEFVGLLGAALCGRAAGALPAVDEAGFQKLIAAGRGKVLLIDFWATWCAACRAEMPHLVKLSRKLAPRGFQLITISADEPEQIAKAEQYLRQQGVPLPAYSKQSADDDKFITSIDPKWSGALPAMFLYDKNGKMRSFIGETPMSEVEAAVDKLL
ncbi:MAG: TlpA family protein disulfide reductase [Bryobacteraceae bacterium]